MATDHSLVQKCRELRAKGFTLGEITAAINLPKTTVFDHIRDISLPPKIQKLIQEKRLRNAAAANKKRKGKCWSGREIVKPTGWSNDLLFLTAHFMFDGEIKYDRCVYQNRSVFLINQVKHFMERTFSNLKPSHYFYKNTGVHRLHYGHVELADYIKHKSQELKHYILTASLEEKKIFLRSFFDDEGSVYSWRNARKIRGYQHNLEILKLIQELLKEFGIESKIDEKYQEIVISRKENLVNFRDKINFSKGIYINPNRKNSIWKQKLEKREILDRILNSYLN